MKLIATAQTFSSQDYTWIEYEIYSHGNRYRIQEEDCGLGWRILGIGEEPTRRWGKISEVRDILTMHLRDVGTVNIINEQAVNKIFEKKTT
jgi:hypothetical protein